MMNEWETKQMSTLDGGDSTGYRFFSKYRQQNTWIKRRLPRSQFQSYQIKILRRKDSRI